MEHHDLSEWRAPDHSDSAGRGRQYSDIQRHHYREQCGRYDSADRFIRVSTRRVHGVRQHRSPTVNTNDNVGVAAVWYFLDGNSLGKQTFPYAMTWDTTRTANGAHTLTATAYDAANNTRSASINVTVNNIAASGASVTFLGMDTTTLGNWKGVYGQDGNVIAQHSVVTPSYSTSIRRGIST